MNAPQSYEKRAQITQKDQVGTIYYSSEIEERLSEMDDLELFSFRCSGTFIRTVQGVYFLENAKTEFMEKKRVKNFDFLEYMRSREPHLPKYKKILSARVCELENQTLILMYTVGKYNAKGADFQPPRQVVLNSYDNEALLEVIPKNRYAGKIGLNLYKSKSHARCDKLFQAARDGTFFLLCEEKEDYLSKFSVYSVNVITKDHKVLGTCINTYGEKIEAECN
jgi:hypothetical protein